MPLLCSDNTVLFYILVPNAYVNTYIPYIELKWKMQRTSVTLQ